MSKQKKSEKRKVKKEKTAHKHIILFSLLFSLSSFANAQAFDDMPYPHPDTPTFFQQEMSSLMKFQAANNLNIPFFISGGFKMSNARYSSSYVDSLYAPYRTDSSLKYSPHDERTDNWTDLLVGGQIKINNAFYIPLFVQFGAKWASTITEEYTEKVIIRTISAGNYLNFITEIKGPANAQLEDYDLFAGTGLFINTAMVKGGIYLGYATGMGGEDITMVYKQSAYSDSTTYLIKNSTLKPHMVKIALVPLVNTSEWAVVGKALESIFGYFGLNDVLYSPKVDKENSKFAAYAKTINAALDLSFNKIKWGNFDLNLNALYTRGNFDRVSKTDPFGLKAAGLFTNFPFGFTLEGGWKHFYDVSKYFAQDYSDGAYFTGSIYFPFKKATLGFIYQYNNIYGSAYTIAMSINNFIDYFLGYNPDIRFADSGKFDSGSDYVFPPIRAGVRYRHNGWRANNE
jgi:hypothetical protein